MGRILQLYQLQLLDSEIDQVNRQLADIAAQLGESEALTRARAALESAQQAHRDAQTTMQNLDLETKSLANKITGEEKLLYSGKVLSAKEAANLQDEVASLKRRHADLEDRLLNAMVAVEETETALKAAETALTSIEAEWTAGQGDLVQEQAALTKKLADLTARRPGLVEPINGDDLNIYETLRTKRGGRAVSPVKNGVCQGCYMTPSNSKIQRARTGAELMYCGGCGRILYVP